MVRSEIVETHGWRWFAAPLLIGLAFAVIAGARPGLGPYYPPVPMLGLLAAFAAGARMPGIVAMVVSIVLGFAHDLAGGGPVGPWGAAYLLACAIGATAALSQPKFTPGGLWIWFGAAAVLSALLIWGWASLAAGRSPRITPIMAAAGVTVLVFPWCRTLFGLVLRSDREHRLRW